MSRGSFPAAVFSVGDQPVSLYAHLPTVLGHELFILFGDFALAFYSFDQHFQKEWLSVLP